MLKIAIYNVNSENFSYTEQIENLKFEIINLLTLESILDLNEVDLLFCDGSYYHKLANDQKKNIISSLPKLKIVLTGEFSDSYLFEKVQSETVDDFLVVPFGFKEFVGILGRLGLYQTKTILSSESFSESFDE